MQFLNKFVRRGIELAGNAKVQAVAVGTAVATTGASAMAALPTDVDTAITAAQTDVLAMIGKGFAYTGAVVGLMTVLAVFIKIISKGKRG